MKIVIVKLSIIDIVNSSFLLILTYRANDNHAYPLIKFQNQKMNDYQIIFDKKHYIRFLKYSFIA